MIQKYTDSLRIIHIVVEALQRHLIFRAWRLIVECIHWIKTTEPEWAFWIDARAAKESKKVVKVL